MEKSLIATYGNLAIVMMQELVKTYQFSSSQFEMFRVKQAQRVAIARWLLHLEHDYPSENLPLGLKPFALELRELHELLTGLSVLDGNLPDADFWWLEIVKERQFVWFMGTLSDRRAYVNKASFLRFTQTYIERLESFDPTPEAKSYKQTHPTPAEDLLMSVVQFHVRAGDWQDNDTFSVPYRKWLKSMLAIANAIYKHPSFVPVISDGSGQIILGQKGRQRDDTKADLPDL
ncbi:hypothetical protein L3556_14400 [Candidatus Synechococcus calcipolaris G9]|uniref:Uncharacterized protein n=1 Tax=Candidatus Synechococcus calcipolaris G9 TaxID=1497997 RepID=A0ABT6F2M5_9SYNE|nr:hypothetical protein [Candidatus Synechococcus calcipolaris]MDG2992111.1 hypothetical protein [Candidatus Synechococcus calcipolaris G9]